MSQRYIRVLVAWLNLFFKKVIFRSQNTFLVILRLFRRSSCHEVASGGKERIFRDHGLALSTQPCQCNQEEPTSMVVSLAVPLQSGASQPGTSTQPLTSRAVDGRLNGEVSDTQHPHNSILSGRYSMPEPSTISPQSAEPEQPEYSDITLTPIVPTQIKRYDRNVTMYASHTFRVQLFSSASQFMPIHGI